MCGIIAAINFGENKESVNEWVQYQLQDQLNRGQEGFGIVFIDNKRKIKVERSTDIVKPIIDLKMHQSQSIMLHHRFPTSSENKISQTHPILVRNKDLKYDYYVVHNGIISNDTELKKEHEEMGFKYKTERTNSKGLEEFNDSECLAIEVGKFIEKKTSLVNTRGAAAFIAIQINKKSQTAKKLFFGRNSSNPLKMSKSRNKIRLSSEGEGHDIKEEILYSLNLKDYKLKKRKMKFKEYEYKQTTNINKSSKHNFETNYEVHDHYQDYNFKLTEKIAESIETTIDTTADQINAEVDDLMTILLDKDFHQAVYKTTIQEEIDDKITIIKVILEDAAKEIKEKYEKIDIKENEQTMLELEDEQGLTKEERELAEWQGK